MHETPLLVAACQEAAESWHALARESNIFMSDSELETAGHVAMAAMSFGAAAAVRVPEIRRRIKSHESRLESQLYVYEKRVKRCIELANPDDNIYEMILEAEKARFGSREMLACGYIGENADREYLCNAGQVAFHLVEAKAFWGSASNACQDIALRHGFVCRVKRALKWKAPTPMLADIPHTPISQRVKNLIKAKIQPQAENLNTYLTTAKESAAEILEGRPELKAILGSETAAELKKIFIRSKRKPGFSPRSDRSENAN